MDKVLYSITFSVIAYILVMILTRAMGRKLMSQMTYFDFVVGIALGSTMSNLALGPNSNAYSSTTVLIVLTILAVLSGFLHVKSFKFRKLIQSEPVTVITNGKIVEENLGKNRLTLNELFMLLREKNIFNVSDVEFAMMETDGKLSVLPKSQKQPVTPSDLQIPTVYKGLTRDLVMDGQIIFENLKDANLDESWLLAQLKSQGVLNVADVFYAGLDTAGNLYVSVKKTRREKHGQYGLE